MKKIFPLMVMMIVFLTSVAFAQNVTSEALTKKTTEEGNKIKLMKKGRISPYSIADFNRNGIIDSWEINFLPFVDLSGNKKISDEEIEKALLKYDKNRDDKIVRDEVLCFLDWQNEGYKKIDVQKDMVTIGKFPYQFIFTKTIELGSNEVVATAEAFLRMHINRGSPERTMFKNRVFINGNMLGLLCDYVLTDMDDRDILLIIPPGILRQKNKIVIDTQGVQDPRNTDEFDVENIELYIKRVNK